MQGDEGKEQSQRDDRGHDDRRTPVFHKQQHHKSDKDDTLQDIVHHRAYGQVDKVLTIIESYDLHVFGQVVVLYLVDLAFQSFDDLFCVLAFAHDHDALHDIIVFAASHLTEAWLTTLVHGSQVAHKDRCTTNVLHDDVANLPYVVDKSDAAHHVCLGAALDDVATNVDIAVGDGLIEFE